MTTPIILDEFKVHFSFNEVIETSSCFIALTSDDILIMIDKPVTKTIEHKLETIEVLERLGNNKPLPCIYDPSKMKGMEKGVRQLAKQHINQKLSHVAILNPSPTFNVILAFLLKVDGIKIRHKAFSKLEKAINWVQHHKISESTAVP